jgi:hypothetical protein
MRSLVFDTGPVISLTLNNLLWILEPLKARFKGDFCITRKVYRELVEQPLETKKYKFEAMQILPLVASGTLRIVESDEIHDRASRLHDTANRCFSAEGSDIRIVHPADMETVAAALALGAEGVVFDERTTRMLIEDPSFLDEHLGRKLHTRVKVDRDSVGRLAKELRGLKVIRSFELVAVAFELCLLDKYIIPGEDKLVSDLKSKLLEGALWSVKLSGCSVRTDEIDEAMRMLLPGKRDVR